MIELFVLAHLIGPLALPLVIGLTAPAVVATSHVATPVVLAAATVL